MTTRTARAKHAAGTHDLRYPAHVPMTSEQLHDRAVARREQTVGMVVSLGRMKVISTHEIARRLDTRAPQANRSTAERLHKDRSLEKARAKLAYAKGLLNNSQGLAANGKKMPERYLSATRSVWEAPLAMAA